MASTRLCPTIRTTTDPAPLQAVMSYAASPPPLQHPIPRAPFPPPEPPRTPSNASPATTDPASASSPYGHLQQQPSYERYSSPPPNLSGGQAGFGAQQQGYPGMQGARPCPDASGSLAHTDLKLTDRLRFFCDLLPVYIPLRASQRLMSLSPQSSPSYRWRLLCTSSIIASSSAAWLDGVLISVLFRLPAAAATAAESLEPHGVGDGRCRNERCDGADGSSIWQPRSRCGPELRRADGPSRLLGRPGAYRLESLPVVQQSKLLIPAHGL